MYLRLSSRTERDHQHIPLISFSGKIISNAKNNRTYEIYFKYSNHVHKIRIFGTLKSAPNRKKSEQLFAIC